MRILVDTAAQRLPFKGNQRPSLQNLGPGDIYLDNNPQVDATSGFILSPGDVYEFPQDIGRGSGAIYVAASEPQTDLRAIVIG